MDALRYLQCRIQPSQPSWFPGDEFTASCKIQFPSGYPSNTCVAVRKLHVQLLGTESVDPKWVSNAYHASVPVKSSTPRRIVRTIVASTSTVQIAARIVAGEEARFAVRCQLPAALPPTFSGTSVRYSYQLGVYCEAVPQALSATGAEDNPGVARAMIVARYPVRIEAAAPSQLDGTLSTVGSAASEMKNSTFSPTATASAAVTDTVPFIEYSMLTAEESPRLEIELKSIASLSGAGPSQVPESRMHSRNAVGFLWAPNEDAPAGSATASQQVHGELASRTNGHSEGSVGFAADMSVMSDDETGTVASSRRTEAGLLSASSLTASEVAASTMAGRPTLLSRRSSEGFGTTPLILPREVTSTGESHVYGLNLHGQKLAVVELQQQHQGYIGPGSTLSGTIDFRPGPGVKGKDRLLCHQLVLLLETEETVASEWLLPTHRKAGKFEIRSLYQEVQEVTQDLMFTSFMLTIPHEAPACFQTPLVALSWSLRFEFLVGKRPLQRWAKPESLVWKLPLRIQPAPLPFKDVW